MDELRLLSFSQSTFRLSFFLDRLDFRAIWNKNLKKKTN